MTDVEIERWSLASPAVGSNAVEWVESHAGVTTDRTARGVAADEIPRDTSGGETLRAMTTAYRTATDAEVPDSSSASSVSLTNDSQEFKT